MKTYSEFKEDVLKKVELNVQVGFWLKFVYQIYKKERIDYNTALQYMYSMNGYNGGV